MGPQNTWEQRMPETLWSWVIVDAGIPRGLRKTQPSGSGWLGWLEELIYSCCLRAGTVP